MYFFFFFFTNQGKKLHMRPKNPFTDEVEDSKKKKIDFLQEDVSGACQTDTLCHQNAEKDRRITYLKNRDSDLETYTSNYGLKIFGADKLSIYREQVKGCGGAALTQKKDFFLCVSLIRQ